MQHTITPVEVEADDSWRQQLASAGADGHSVGVTAASFDSGHVAVMLPRSGRGLDVPGRWLGVSMIALGGLAVGAAVVSYSAQYRMVYATKHIVLAATLEAGIPDVAAVIFATLGIALALHGRRALRPRVLNVCAVATSVAMNVLAASHGWRDLAIWAMPPIAYALASDTAIGVVRAWTIARQRGLREQLTDEDATPLAVIGNLLLWMLRLTLAPTSTLSGFRRWVLEECPVAPGRRAVSTTTAGAAVMTSTRRPGIASGSAPSMAGPPTTPTATSTKTQRFLDLVVDRYGPLDQLPIVNVSRVCTELAPEVDLDTGAARTALRRHVLAAQNGSTS